MGKHPRHKREHPAAAEFSQLMTEEQTKDKCPCEALNEQLRDMVPPDCALLNTLMRALRLMLDTD
ncbi:MAG TPA: hypothetical protein VKP69_04960, partial [Isosphaeraceae bacterium]|nr:hypothetical protein [Isosphaeraceae bacterium]